MARKSRKNLPVDGSQETIEVRKAAAYVRLSRETDGSMERDTIGNQTMLVEEFIKKQTDLQLYDTYVDDCVSGTTFVRPAFDRMLSDMRSGRIGAIVVKDMSRLGRDYIEAGNLVEHVFPLYGIRLISITDGFDTAKGANGLMMAVTNLVNAMYAQDISRKINAAKEDMVKRGLPTGKLPYGYKVNRDDSANHYMNIDEETAPVVRRIFQDFIAGKGTTIIARELNEEGVLTDREYRFKKNGQYEKMGRYKWSACTVQQILRNECYTGHYILGRETIRVQHGKKRIRLPKEQWHTFEDHHPAIISKEDFDLAQARKQKKSAPSSHAPNLLKNKVFCGCCGGHMGIPDSGARNPKYMCRRSVQYERDCATGYVPKQTVYDAVFKAVKDMVRTFMDEKAVLARCHKAGQADDGGDRVYYERQLRQCRKKLKQYESKKTALYEDFCKGLLEEEEYLLLNGRYTEDMQALSDAAEQMQESIKTQERITKTVVCVREELARFCGRRKLSQEMVDALIERVIVHSEERIEVVFRFEDELGLLFGGEAGEHHAA